MDTTYPSASVASTAVQLMVTLVAFLWSTVKLVVELGAEYVGRLRETPIS